MTKAKSMTDEQLFELIGETDPLTHSCPPSAEIQTEGDRVLSQILACDRSETEAPERSRQHRRRLIFGAASGVGLAGGAAATALVVFAGSAPALAQAFPIFSKPPINVNLSVPGGHTELKDARVITTPYGTGYIATAENESELCVAIPVAVHDPWVTGTVYTGRCDPIAEAEQRGFVLRYAMALPPAGSGGLAEELVAVLPAGVSDPTVHNADGTTTPLTAEGGIATAIEQSPTTINYQAEGQTVSFPVAESTPGTSPLPGAWRPPSESTNTTTAPAGNSGASSPATP